MAALLRFERDGDHFRAATPERGDSDRLFGGLIAALALGAAGATVEPGVVPHSLHSYFIRSGRSGSDVELSVDRVRDGRSFATRRVTVTQQDSAIFEMIASFHRPESGPDHHRPAALRLDLSEAVSAKTNVGVESRFELLASPTNREPWVLPPFWFRTRDRIEDDPLIRACVLTFISDIGPMPTAHPPGIPLGERAGFAASLDHSVWFHRAYDPQEWHCYDMAAVSHTNNRGLVQGVVLSRDGTPIASTAQESLWRL